MLKSVIVFAHGSRDPLWHEPIKAIAMSIQSQSPTVLVRCAYLEMTTPSLLDCASELVALGVNEINLFPLFLGVGRHAREDLPEQAQALREKHPGVSLKVMPSAGEIPEVVAFLAQTALKGLEL